MLDIDPESTVSITDQGVSVFTYNYGDSLFYPYFHPVYASNGELMTHKVEDSEQKYSSGLCFSLGTVLDVNKNLVEFTKFTSSIDRTHTDLSNVKDILEFTDTIVWQAKEVNLFQTSNINIYPLQDDVRIIDLSFEISTDSETLSFDNGLGLNYNAVEMEHRKSVDSEGRIGEAEVNGKEAEWGAFSGITNDTAVGCAIIPDSSNGKTIFYSLDTQRGYISAQYSPLTLNPDEIQEFKFRLLVYLGDLFTFDVQEHYKQYNNKTE
ncbi:PmoA family protein [Candidatus Poribacteria bacterium]|nr:PmoA family protein [Candidatus Poribacteria bacterium]